MSVVEREKKVSIVEPENRETREKREVYEGCKKMSICSQEVCKWSEKCQRETGSLCSQSEDNRPTSPIPERELEMIVRRNVMAAAQSHEVHKSKRTTSTSVSKMSTAEHVCAQSLATQMALLGSRGLSPRLDTQDPLDISSRPHDVKSLLPPACVVRPMSPTQTVVFPPNLPEVMESRSRSPSPCPRRQKSNLKKTSDQQSGTVVWVDQSGGDSAGFPPSFVGLPEVKPGPLIECRVEELKSPRQVPTVEVTQEPDQGVEHLASQDDQTHQATQQYSRVVTEIREIQEESRLSDIASAVRSVQWDEHVKPATPKPQEEPLEEKLYTKNEVEKIIKEELTKVFLNQEEPPKKERPPEISINDLPKPKYASGGMAEALSTASDRPFTPAPSLKPNEPKEPKKKIKPLEKYVPCPEPSEPYFPPTPPPPDSEKKDERIARALREVGCRSPMTEALTTAPERAYSPLPTTAKMDVSKIPQLNVEPAKDVSTPIKSVKPPIRIESAFRPTGNGNGSLVPKSTPLVYIPHAQQAKREVSMEERYGIDRQEVAQGGRTKQMVAGYELASTVPEVAEIDKSQLTKETKVEYRCAVARNPPPQSTQQTPQRAATSGLRADHLLPCYQQFLGDIPTRLNRATSPVPPHQIKAPSMEPRPLPATPNLTNRPKTPSYYTSSSCWNTNTGESTKKAKEIICAYNTTAASQEASCKQSKTVSETSSTTTCGKVHKVSSRTSRNVSPLAGKPATVTSSGKQTFKPDIPARSLSPAWKADYVRSVQNLSPLTVRLPSPVPPAPLPPKGEKTQTTTANVIVKNKSKTTSAKLPKHTTSIQSSKPGQNMGSCGTSQGCGTPPSSGRSTPTHCGTAQGCGTPPPGEQKGSKHCGTSQGCGTPPPREQKGSKHCGTSEGCGTPPRCPSPRKGLSKAETKNVSSQMIENKENITITNMQRSHEMSSFGKTTSTSAFASLLKKDEMTIQRNNLAGILKTATDTKSKRAPFQTSSSNISWIPYPTNLPLPRDCGVNPSSSGPNAGGAGGLGGGRSSIAGATAPRRGRGVLNAAVPAGGRVPLCGHCNNQIRGPFITALGKIWCPEHFICVNPKCKRPLQDIGFVEEDDGLYCEYCFEQYLAPSCDKCRSKIKGDCLNAIGKHFHPECFKCSYCEKLFGNNPFFLEDGLPYCENDWNELFTTKCFSCGFPIEAGDRWVEALNNNYHSQCFNCTMCKKNLEGQSFFAKGGRPFCKNHAR